MATALSGGKSGSSDQEQQELAAVTVARRAGEAAAQGRQLALRRCALRLTPPQRAVCHAWCAACLHDAAPIPLQISLINVEGTGMVGVPGTAAAIFR